MKNQFGTTRKSTASSGSQFQKIEHEWVGTDRIYRFDPSVKNDYSTPNVILFVNDTVTVLSAWTRPYLSSDAPILFYVQSHTTGESTHVTAEDLSVPAEFVLKAPGES